MRMEQGYWGPVVHYWQDCLHFLGPSPDWKYEGLIDAFLTIYKKTKQEEFLHQAILCGNDLLRLQGKNSCFFNSHFENNPSLYDGSTPHESSVCIGLLTLAKKLREDGLEWKPYFNAAQKNIEQYHFRVLYDSDKKTFLQYRHDPKPCHVPNKIATIVEMLYLYYDFTQEKYLLSVIQRSINYIISHQDPASGGIYQTESKKHLITFYIARCIPALILHYERTKDQQALDCALFARKFILSMRLKQGGFRFGYLLENSSWTLYTYPIFIAGAADILRALFLLRTYAPFSFTDLHWLLGQQHRSGAFPTSLGMNYKNTTLHSPVRSSWRDVLPVIGWNDKVLRLCALLLKEGETLDQTHFSKFNITCTDGIYHEDVHSIRIAGKEPYFFPKRKTFAHGFFYRSFLLWIARNLPLYPRLIRRIFRFLLR